ncbi:MAG: hypothetical protein U0610_31070 [bacterium]
MGRFAFLAENILFRRSHAHGHPHAERSLRAGERDRQHGASGQSPGHLHALAQRRAHAVDDIHVRGSFHNLSTTTTLEDMVRAVLEGVAYNTRWASATSRSSWGDRYSRCS